MLRFHSGGAAIEPAEVLTGVRIGSPPRCAADGLRWEALDRAIPAVVSALWVGLVGRDEVARIIRGEN
ncbi:MAG: hypothetical protein MUP36_03655, partial [Demequinaceae bacterium]|nr:hypothetical protein [Demequinaceae bacterium]